MQSTIARAREVIAARKLRANLPDEYFETIDTPRGKVDVYSGIEVNGDTIHLKDLMVYPQENVAHTGLNRYVVQHRTKLETMARDMGFKELRINFERHAQSTSMNPGVPKDLHINLYRSIPLPPTFVALLGLTTLNSRRGRQ